MRIFRAKYLIPRAGHLIENGAIAIQGDRIVAVGRRGEVTRIASGTSYDLGPSVILPGFVNAHSHLELTALGDCIQEFSSFTDWIRQILPLTRTMTDRDFEASINDGIRTMLSSGITTVGDIVTRHESGAVLGSSQIRVLAFHETISYRPEGFEEDLHQLSVASGIAEVVSRVTDGRMRGGISPHSPYTVSARMFRACIDLAREKKMPISSHFAETRDEADFLAQRGGPLVEYYRRHGWPTDLGAEGTPTPIEYAERLGLLGMPAVLAHVNYPEEADWSRLAGGKASVVYCPGSHAYFRHSPHPVERLRKLGVTVALGTDSRASNATLDFFREMRIVRKAVPGLTSSEILGMATEEGAKALGWLSEIGTLEVDKQADFIACFGVNGENPETVAGSLIEEASPPFLVMIAGRPVISPKGL